MNYLLMSFTFLFISFQRSKSAPNLNRKEYVPSYPPSYPNRQLFYTKSHYLAIKQPFSKKYLLPPVRTFYAERPAAKRVVVPAPAPRQVVVPPPRQEVVKPNVYHVQYKASPNQIVHRTKLTENIGMYSGTCSIFSKLLTIHIHITL
jgi:hypothetical protein